MLALTVGGELYRFLYESRDLKCVVAYQSTIFLSEEELLN